MFDTMILGAMKRFSMFWLFSIMLLIIQTTTYHGLSVDAGSLTSHKARPKIDLSDPFYDGQIQYDDTLTETPIGTIIYAIDDKSSETDPLDSQRNKHFQLQDVVTHGNINDKSFMNHNLFTIGDGNDANTDIESDEDDDLDDGIDNDGVIDKQATHSKFSNFAFSSDKSNRHSVAAKHSHNNANSPLAASQSHSIHKPQQKQNATETNDKNNKNKNHDLRQLQHRTADNNNDPIATHSPNGQMTYKQSNKTMEARVKSHRHHNRKANKWSRRHPKWLKPHISKSHHNRHSSLSRSGSKPQQIHGNQNIRTSPAFVQAHVNFYDSNGDDSLKSNRMPDMPSYRSGNKWPHLSRLQSQLHQDILGDSLPPYIRKYHRRNKQLIGLLEGEGMPNINGVDSKRKLLPHSVRRRKHHNTNNNKWIEKNLFEEQQQSSERKNRTASLPSIDKIDPIALQFNSKQRYLIEKNLQSEANALPGEHLSMSEEDYNDCDDENEDCHQPKYNQHRQQHQQKKQQQQQLQQQHQEPKLNLSPKANSFLFHRVATPRLVGTASIGGGLIKQKLPFVALTDKRIEDGTRQRHINTIQNTFPLP